MEKSLTNDRLNGQEIRHDPEAEFSRSLDLESLNNGTFA